MHINKLMESIYFESEDKYLGNLYRPKSWVRSFLWVLGSLLFSNNGFPGNMINRRSESKVSVCFFVNEYESLVRQEFDPYYINLRKLGFLRAIGPIKFVKLTLMFVKHRHKYPKSWHIQYVAFMLHFYFYDFFESGEISTVTVANIWHPCSLAVVLAARELDIKVRYVEHAVTPKRLMCNLHWYDSAIVEYKFTKLLMEDRCDSIHVSLRSSVDRMATPILKGIKRVSICVNDLDSAADMHHLIGYLEKLDLYVDVRFHLADRRFRSFKNKYRFEKVVVSSSRECLFEKYVKHYDLVIAGNSNVIADCIVLGVSCLYYWNGDPELYDYYGVVDYFGITTLDDFSVLNGYL